MSKDISKDDHHLVNKFENQDPGPVIKLQAMSAGHKKSSKSRERGKALPVGITGTEPGLVDMVMDEEKYKEMRRDRKKDSFKSVNLRTKKITSKPDDIKKNYTSNLSLSSPPRNSRNNLSHVSPGQFKTYKSYISAGNFNIL